ncbi:MAG: polyketide synthase dehydratase domain-containing protein, partial [Myxococcales bacterium]|nr:polyketide synthase dehydratase domain-containing protein [Myxococcales bacterium]
RALDGLAPRPAKITMYSTVRARVVAGGELDPGYWADNSREPVRFDEVVLELLSRGPVTFVEIGPHPVLGYGIKQWCDDGGRSVCLASLRRELEDRRATLELVARLYERGHEPDWAALVPHGSFAELPSYFWDRQRHWPALTPQRVGNESLIVADTGNEGGRVLSVQLAAETWIGDHRVGEIALVPGAAYLVWARRAVTGHGDAIEVCDLSIEAALPLAEDEHAELQAVCHFVEPGVWDAELLSSKGGSWIRHARARVIVAGGESGEAPTSVASLAEARGRCREPLSGEALYQNLANAGLRYGPAFRGLTELWLGAGEAVAELRSTEEVGRSRGLHPAWVDAAQHAVAPLLPAGRWLPIAVKSLRVFSPIPERAFVHARLRVQDAELPTAREVEADFVVYTDEGAPVATLRGLRLHLVEAAVSRRDELRLFEDSWVQAPLATQSRPPVRERWLIFGDDHELSASLAEALRGHPHASVDFLRSLSPASAEQIAGAAVIVLGGGRPESLWKPLQHILRAEAEPSRVSILTRGAWAPREIKDSAVPDPLARAAWGLGRTLRHEQPAWDLLLIDVEARNWAASLSAAAAALVNLDDERELLFYRGDRWVGVKSRDGREVRADWVVVANGAHSTLSTVSGPKRMIHAIMGWWQGVPFQPHTIEMFWDDLTLPYYGWLFPEAEGRVNIGITYQDDLKVKNARRIFQAFLDKHFRERLEGAEQLGKWKGHPIVYTYDIDKLWSPGRVVVGEAGRMTHPATGEGISQGMRSGMF